MVRLLARFLACEAGATRAQLVAIAALAATFAVATVFDGTGGSHAAARFAGLR
jgi:hypothetical protein